jgi:hypothetical protein
VNVSLRLNLEDVMADLNTIDEVVPAQVQRIVARSAQRFEAAAKGDTPVGKKTKRAGQRLSTGWQRRVVEPDRVEIVNIRPHAHLAAEGWNHVSGKRVAAFVPWIRQAVRERGRMVDEMTALVGRGFPVRLRALEVVP